MVAARQLFLGFLLGFFGVTLWFRLTHVPRSHSASPAFAQAIGRRSPCDVPAHSAAISLTPPSPLPSIAPPPASSPSPSLPAPLPYLTLAQPRSNVAMCIGGLISFDIMQQGESVRLGVVEPLRPDVFVAGTLNGTRDEVTAQGGQPWRRRIANGLFKIAALAPFVSVEVEPQPTAQGLRAALEASGHLPAYERQSSGAGAGKLRPTDTDPRLWLPTMLSPAVGNPQANTLREFHYQSRCMRMIEEAERSRRGGKLYERVLFTRVENHWLHPHPPLALLSPDRVWVPAGEDNGGVNDRHWLAPRRFATMLMRRWDALLDGSALVALHGSKDPARVRAHFLSSEMYLRRFAVHHGIGIGRFPMLSYLACCEDIYTDAQGRLIGSDQSVDAVLSTGEGYERKARTCYQPHCNRKRCPTRPPLQHARSATHPCEKESSRSGFKYDMEGSAAIINAELLSLPGASLAVGAGPPARVEITVPIGDGGKHAHAYFCMGCDQASVLTREANLTAGCLLSSHPYQAPHLIQALAAKHACRYFDPITMKRLCNSFSLPGDLPDHRGNTYAEQYFPWWCRGL